MKQLINIVMGENKMKKLVILCIILAGLGLMSELRAESIQRGYYVDGDDYGVSTEQFKPRSGRVDTYNGRKLESSNSWGLGLFAGRDKNCRFASSNPNFTGMLMNDYSSANINDNSSYDTGNDYVY